MRVADPRMRKFTEKSKDENGTTKLLHINQLMECVCAIHLSSYVDSPVQERGGLMLVGPPANFKTTVLEVLRYNYPGAALVLSDLNVQTLVDLKDDMASEKLRTLVFPELGKIYERNPQSASNLEGHLRALASEGFSQASFQDQRMRSLRAQATVLGAMTTATMEKNFKRWEETGFNRRFLWGMYTLKDPMALTRAVEDWVKVDVGFVKAPGVPNNGSIPMLATGPERRKLSRLTQAQPGGDHTAQVRLLVKVLSVLRWHYKRVGIKYNAMDTVEAFAGILSEHGAKVVL